jgi:hypothetical protein
MSKGLLLAAFDFSTAHADEFHDWYDHEHLPERLGVPGFLNAERWLETANPAIHVATYDLESPDVLRSAAYRAVSGNPTPWTRRVTGMARRLMRFDGAQLVPGDLAAPSGAAGLLIAAMNVAPAAQDEFTRWYNEEHLPRLAGVPGVLAARRYQAVDTASERRFVAVYHLEDVAVSRSEAWSNAANTEWSARLRPHFESPFVWRMQRYQRRA